MGVLSWPTRSSGTLTGVLLPAGTRRRPGSPADSRDDRGPPSGVGGHGDTRTWAIDETTSTPTSTAPASSSLVVRRQGWCVGSPVHVCRVPVSMSFWDGVPSTSGTGHTPDPSQDVGGWSRRRCHWGPPTYEGKRRGRRRVQVDSVSTALRSSVNLKPHRATSDLCKINPNCLSPPECPG